MGTGTLTRSLWVSRVSQLARGCDITESLQMDTNGGEGFALHSPLNSLL